MPSKRNLANSLAARKQLAVLGLFLLSLAVFNFAFARSSGWARIFWSLAGYATLFITYKWAGLHTNEAGLSVNRILPGLKLAAYTIAIIASLFLLAFLIDKNIYQDSRYNHGLLTALYSSVVLLPLKTVFFEEIAFRGILLGLLIKIVKSQKMAVIISSLCFGLWHIISSAGLSNGSVHSDSAISKIGISISVVTITFLAGVFFCWLRLRSKSLAAPIAVHWFINGFAVVLASLSWM